MTKEDRAYYDNYLTMFGTDGWKQFKDEFGGLLNSLIEGAVSDCDTNDKWMYRRGEVIRLQQVVNFEEFIRAVVDEDGNTI